MKMTSGGIDWKFCLYLPLAAGVTLCLMFLMQSSVMTPFVMIEPESKTISITSVEFSTGCDCPIDNADMSPRRGLYQPIARPPRMEPDRSCDIELGFPKYIIIPYLGGNAWVFDPEGERRRARLREEEAKKDKRDKCPLILKT